MARDIELRTFQVLLVLSICFILGGCATGDLRPALYKSTSQDATTYLNPNTQNQPLISTVDQNKLTQNYFEHYFSPWTGKARIADDATIKQDEVDRVAQWQKNPGWGHNELRYKQAWLDNIKDNMDLTTYPNRRIKAIVITPTDVRSLPTNDPIFSKITHAPSGYPFDRVQSEIAPAGLPVLILHVSKDGAWSLIESNNDIGWVRSETLATVDANFIRHWKTRHYVSVINNQISVFAKDRTLLFTTRAGSVYPLVNASKDSYKVLVPISVAHHNAAIKTATIAKADAVVMPLPITPYNVAVLANHFMGYPYGWGEMYGYRDCSSTIMELFTSFGIWLPRDSGDQAHTGKFISLAHLPDDKKWKIIHDQGVPYLTLLWPPGHIVLYLGEQHGKLYIFHTTWSLHTWFNGQAMLAQTVITPIDFGKQYINIPKSYIDHIQGMTILGE